MNFTLENYCFVRNHKTKDCGTLVCFNDFFLIWYCPFITQLSPWNLLPSCHPRIYYPTPLPTPQVVFTTFSIWCYIIKSYIWLLLMVKAAVNDFIGLVTFQSKIYVQLPWAQIEQKSKKFSAHQIANDKTMMLSIEIVQKVHSRPKLQRFEVKITAKLSIEAWWVLSLNSHHRVELGPNPIIYVPIK